MSRESDASNYEDAHSNVADSDEIDSDDEYELESDDQDDLLISTHEEHLAQMHQFLFKDMETLLFLYGESSLEYRLFESIDQIDIELHIPMSFLEEVIAQAWGVNRKEPLIVRLHLSLSRYIESFNVPKIEVFQPSTKNGFGFGSQVRMFCEMFITQQWKSIVDDYHKCVSQEEKMKKSQTFPVTGAQDDTAVNAALLVSDEQIAKLVETGFDAVMSRNALIITHGDIEAAMNLILNSPATCYEEPVSMNLIRAQESDRGINTETSSAPDATAVSNTEDPSGDSEVRNPSGAGRLSRQLSHPPQILNKLKKMTRTTSMMPNLDRQMEDLNLMPLTTLDGKNAKKIPSLADGFLVQLFRYIRQRIPTVNEYCVICDQQHVFQNGAMLKPAVCSRDLCVFAFQTLGVMADAAEDIASGAEVVDLLINMSKFACRSSRKGLIFDPYPTVVHPKNPRDFLFTPDNKKFDAVKAVLEDIPCMQDMSSSTAALKQKLDTHNFAIYPLIQWIITSNR